jgi:aryl-alcohol dehydrogenase-like predicted oxidoreductase
VEKREYGKSGDKISVIGFGGICVTGEDTKTSAAMVSEAIDRDISYFDVAPSYGNAQEMLGPALEPFRNQVFLACKTTERTASGSRLELEASLKLLKTDHFDLYQLHSVTDYNDVSGILAADGALKTLIEAREEGLIRHIGFSAHSGEAAVALAGQFDFDSILFPLNWVNWIEGEFGHRVVKLAEEKNISLLALKMLAKRKWEENEERSWAKTWYRPVDTYEEAKLAVRFTLSLPVTAGPTPGHMELLRWACDAAEEYTALDEDGLAQLRTWAKGNDPIFSSHESLWQ